MLWKRRFKRRCLFPVTGFVLAMTVWQLSYDFLGFDFIPPVVNTVEAAVLAIDPTANGTTVQGTPNGCTVNFDCINDGDRDPAIPALPLSEYVQFNRDQEGNYQMADIPNVASVSSITVHMYHLEGRDSYFFEVGLYDTNETTQHGTTQTLGQRLVVAGWDSVTFSSLSLTQTQLNNLRIKTRCIRSGGGNSNCRDYVMYASVTYTETNAATVSALGTQQNVIKDIDQELGGSFAIISNSGSSNVTSITVNETGSIDAANDLKNIKLFYDRDLSDPYNCDGETYGGGESPFGSTDTDGFSGANGSSVFSGSSIGISSTAALCLYVVVDVQAGASAGDDIEVQISNPSTDVVGSGSLVVSPGTAIAISGPSTVTEAVPSQSGYHWRHDNNNEADATSATGGTENSAYNNFPKATPKRLRLQVSNTGNSTTNSIPYRLEFASKTGYSNCSDIPSGWTDVNSATDDFDMFNTGNLTDGNNTTDVSTGGVSNPGGKTFQGTNAGQKDTSSQTSGITLTSSQFTEIEYSIQSSGTVSDGSTYCFRLTDAGTPLTSYVEYPELTVAADIDVSASGAHTATALITSTDNNSGGVFVISDTGGGPNTLTGVKISEVGSVVASTSLEDVQLRYDLDITDPYICDDQSYDIGDSTFGSPTTFNDSSEASFTGSLVASTTRSICLYAEYNVNDTASNGEKVELQISNPSADVIVTSSTVAPASAIGPSGSTTLQRPIVTQADYHWRNNDGDQVGASSATGGSENSTLDGQPKNSIIRLRMSVGNTGLASAPAANYRLEWRQKVTSCDVPTGWERVDTGGDEWEMGPTGNLTQGGDTTDIAEGIGGVSDPAGTFLIDNNGVADDNDTTSASTLPADNYLDVEYAIRATNSSVQGATYCFRVTDSGTPLDTYTNYPEIKIRLDTDFKIQRGFVIATSTAVIIRAGADYEAPASASSSFIRINNTQLTGAGPNTGNGNNNADDVTVYITNPDNIVNDIVFQRNAFPGGNTRISWEIVEYTGVASGENEIIVRHSDVLTYVSGNTTVSGPTVSSVADDGDVVAFITSQYNPDAGRNSYNLGLSTSAWNSGSTQVDLTRGASGNEAVTSYSLVEFTGSNWNIERIENSSYSLASTTETEAIVPSLSDRNKAFLHAQKRTSQNNHADLGHEVWLSSMGAVSFRIDSQASTPSAHASVAWVIENRQAQGQIMDVTRTNGTFTSAGLGPEANVLSLGITLDDMSVTSLFVNNVSDEASRSWPEPILGVRLLSTTQYELWRSDTTANIAFRTEIVEWPTAARKLEQDYFWLYSDNDELLPTDPWPPTGGNLGENAPMTPDDGPMASGDIVRIRMALTVTGSAMPAGLDSFKLLYGKQQTTCSAISNWFDVGEIGSTTAPWRGVNNTPADGTQLSVDPPTGGDLIITLSTVAGTYEEQNPSALNPHTAFPGDGLEFDWVVQHNGADDKSSYCFRMEEADGTPLEAYNIYPILRTVGFEPLITNWRWYDDETSLTPSSPLSAENVAPVDIVNENAIKLRLVLREGSGAAGTDLKFALQFSEYADFSKGVATATPIATCSGNSLWCFYDGSGVDNELVDSVVITDADSCVAGVGDGCGAHNEGTSTVGAIVDQPAFASTEYEFTIAHAGARANAVYYFRLYDMINNEFVALDSGSTYPSLVTEGAQLVSTLSGLPPGTTVAGVTSDVGTTPNSIGFGSLPFNTSYAAIQRIAINTNATEGYQLFVYTTQQLTNSYGDIVPPITGTNATPDSWGSSCTGAAIGCFGYHTTDATLSSPSGGRFGPIDSYAAFETIPQEVMFSSIPIDDSQDMIYRILVTEEQPAGDYQTGVVYIATPTF